jgi:predicted  nucleic acid-binding Zn-ribbon protein
MQQTVEINEKGNFRDATLRDIEAQHHSLESQNRTLAEKIQRLQNDQNYATREEEIITKDLTMETQKTDQMRRALAKTEATFEEIKQANLDVKGKRENLRHSIYTIDNKYREMSYQMDAQEGKGRRRLF